MDTGSHKTSGGADIRPDPRLLDKIGPDYARYHGVFPVRRVGALTLVVARDMWARLDTVDYLEATLGPVTFVEGYFARSPSAGEIVVFRCGVRILPQPCFECAADMAF